MPKLSVDRAILKAKAHAKKGEITEARQIYQSILEAFPENIRAQQGLTALTKQQHGAPKNPPQDEINHLINLFNQGQLPAVVRQAHMLTQQYPDAFFVWNVLGVANKGLGRIFEASQAFRKVVGLDPTYADGYNNLGSTLTDLGKPEEAIEAYNRALSLKPDYAEAYYNMGISLQTQGKLDAAIEAYERALSLKPDYADACNNIGISLQIQGKLDAAIEAYERALSLKPDYADACNNIGISLQIQGKLDEAIEAFERALSLKPDFADAFNNMGNALKDQGKLDEAIEAYERALSLKPDFDDAFNNMGNALKDQGKLDEAIEAYERALSVKPDFDDAFINMGNALKDQGKLDDAIKAYERALSLKPDFADAFNNMGNALKDQGKLDGAIEAYKKALDIKPGSAESHRNLSTIVKYEANNPQIASVTDLIGNEDLSEADRCQLHFALAKMKDDLGDFSAAFDNYVSGGMLRSRLLDYDLEQDQTLFNKIKKTSVKLGEVSLTKSQDTLSHTPIFILGMPRSGTTLFEQIVSCHSQVHGAGELPFLSLFGLALSTGDQTADSETLLKFRDSYLAELTKLSSDKPFVTDKMPHNFLYIGLILNAIPEAKIIHIKRDPGATCWSNFKHYFPAQGLGYSYKLSDTANYYKLYQDLMRFWDELYGGQILHMDYDRMTVEQEPETRSLIDSLGLSWEAKCLSPHENQRSVRTASQQQVRKKMYTGSSQAWRQFEPYLDGAFDDLIA